MKNQQLFLSPSAGKKLIAKGIGKLDVVQHALAKHSILIVAGTTNYYVANELLKQVGQPPLNPKGFYRGVVTPLGNTPERGEFIGDILIEKGRLVKEKCLVDEVAPKLSSKDIIFKGANAVNLKDRQAGTLVASVTTGGTIMAVMQAHFGKRARFIVPVGVEKRVDCSIFDLAALCNDPNTEGLKMIPSPGEIFTELDAIKSLFGIDAKIIASGGVQGAEGGVFLHCSGEDEQMEKLLTLYEKIREEKLVL